MKPAGTVQAKRNGTVVEAQHSTLAATKSRQEDGVRDEERRRSDKGTKRRGVAQGFWPRSSAKQLLVCGFSEGSFRKMKSLRLCKLVYLNLILLRAPCSPHLYTRQ